MTSNNIYFIDTDAAIKIKRELIQTSFFSNYCALTEENIYELRDNGNVDLFSKCKVEIDLNVLENLSVIWSKIDPKDKILNLYMNKGNGDIVVLATLLSQTKQKQKTLFKDNLVLVTDDQGLSAVAKKFSFDVIKSNDFIKILEANR